MGKDRVIHMDRYIVLDEAEQEMQHLADKATKKG
jgi:hypothetical protein